MKTFFISLVVSILIYISGGMIVWNLVCSFAIDVPNLPITTLEKYRLFTYSGLTGVVMLITQIIEDDCTKNREEAMTYFYVALGINLAIAIGVNYWNTVWDAVLFILGLIYNLGNIGIMTMTFFAYNDNDID